MEKTIYELVREAKKNDEEGGTVLSKYVTVSMREDIDITDAYLNSKHISGLFDSQGREKPFFNVVNAAVNVWYRATDIDRKNIVARATELSGEIEAFFYTIYLQKWMNEVNFGQFLNDWGLTLAKHGSAISEFVKKDGKLIPTVLDWNSTIIDPIDFENNIKIKRLWFTPSQLKKQKNYDKDAVKSLCENLQSRETMDKQKTDNKDNYIEVFEVHGELPLSYLTDDEADEDTYVNQMHVISFNVNKEKPEKFNDYTLYSGREEKCPQMLSHLIKKDGQSYTGGAVKNLFDVQWIINHNEKQKKDHLDLAAKIIFQTSDGSFVAKNATNAIDNGDFLIHKPNEPLTLLNNRADIGGLQSNQTQWLQNAAQINGISEAMLGVNPPSGTAWRQTQALLQEAHSLFELMTENKGLEIIRMFEEYIDPYIREQMNNKEEIMAILEDHQIKQIDSLYIPNEAQRRLNRIKKEVILKGQIYDPINEAADLQTATTEIQNSFKGNQRFFKPSELDDKTWKDIFKNKKFKIDIDVTGEAKDIPGTMATLTTVLTTLAGNPQAINDPNIKLVFSRILQLSGAISPLEITSNQPSAPMAAQPQPIPQPA